MISNNSVKDKQADVRISLPIHPRPNKSILAKLKFFEKNNMNSQTENWFYTQALKNNIKDLFKIKNVFFKLFSKFFLEIQNITKST